jgi:hypothetical protein
MKKFFIFSIFIALFSEAYAQWGGISFDDRVNLYRIKIDTSVPNNIWQIGKPNKTFFTSAHSIPNAIVTDTIHPYPTNNNSVFYLGVSLPGDWMGTILEFYYKMDSDTLNDFGKIEFSIDTGKTFFNMLPTSDYTVYDSAGNIIAGSYFGSPIVFTGKSHSWYLCTIFSQYLPAPDTITYRFTFHSDGIQNNRAGWMIDNSTYGLWAEGIQEKSQDFKIFPNPVKDILQCDSKTKIKEISVISELGRTLVTKSITSTPISLDLKDLPDGMYILKIINNDNAIGLKKFIKLM